MKKLLLFVGTVFGFVGYSQMTTESEAVEMGTCDCYQLTNSTSAGQNGAIWSPNTIDLTNPFDFSFEIYLGNNDSGSDGMVFVLQSNPDGIGNIGYTLGYGSPFPAANPVSTQSLGVEVDTYYNGAQIPTDITSDHIGLSNALSIDHNLAGPFAIPEIEDGAYHTFQVVWSAAPTNTLAVILDGIPIFSYSEDFINTTFGGDPNVYFGWTGATGYADQQVVCTYRNADFASDLSSVCPDLPVVFTDASSSDLNNIASWSWDFDDASPLDNSQNPSHTWTTPGTYTVELTMTDVFDCPATYTTDITVLPDLILAMDSVETTCFGDVDGEATGVPTNGSGTYTYLWDDGSAQTTQTATGLIPGSYYTVTVTDDLGCIGVDSVLVTEPAMILLAMDSTDVLCHGGSDGTVTTNTTNGVAPFNYVWNDGGSQTTQTATGLGMGTYTVTVTDDNGCTAIDSISVGEASAIAISGTIVDDNGTSNGSCDATVSGGTGPYTYAWSNGETSEDISGLAAGDYTLVVTDANGCIDSLLFIVKSTAGLSSSDGIDFDIYPNPTDGLFYVVGTGSYNLIITDVSGRVVLNELNSETTEVNLSSFERGIYVIKIEQEGNTLIKKIVLQ